MKLQIEAEQTLRNQPVHIVTFACEIPLGLRDTPKDYADNEDRNISTHQSFGLHPPGGGPDPYCHALQEIRRSKVKSKLPRLLLDN